MLKTTSKPYLLAIVVTASYLHAIGAAASQTRLAQASTILAGCVSESTPSRQRIDDCTRLNNEVPAALRENACSARGHAYRDAGDNDHAVGDYTKALDLQPRDKEALYASGYVLHDKGTFDQAIADYNAAIAIDGTDRDIFYSRALSNQAKGDLEHAIADYTTVIGFKPSFANAYHNRGVAYRQKGDAPSAGKDEMEYQRLRGKGG
jgi:tetratricopeptide (TPR) repeat protein